MPLFLLLSTAFAADPAPTDPVLVDTGEEAHTGKTRDYLMEVNFRGRYLFLPDSLLDIWYEKHLGGADDAPERPTISGYALGLEFVAKDDHQNGIFYVEYISSLLKEGYWDDRDNPPIVTDGSYIVPESLGIIAVGADYAYAINATDWFAVLIGGGVTVGVRTGKLVEWEPGEPEGSPDPDNLDATCGTTEAAYQRVDHCGDDGEVKIPRVLPMLDINLAMRFNFSDRASLRIEGGVNYIVYGGAALGITF